MSMIEQFVSNVNHCIKNNLPFTVKIDDLKDFYNDLIDVGSVFFNYSIVKQEWSTEISSVGSILNISVFEANKIYNSWRILMEVAGYIQTKTEKKEEIHLKDFTFHINYVINYQMQEN